LNTWVAHKTGVKTNRCFILFRLVVFCVRCAQVDCGNLTYRHYRMTFHKFDISIYFALQQLYLTAQ
jgi:hypothetical protein